MKQNKTYKGFLQLYQKWENMKEWQRNIVAIIVIIEGIFIMLRY